MNLKKYNPVLHDIHTFIVDAEKLGYGEVEILIKTHDYVAKTIQLKAKNPKKKVLAKSVTKRIMIKK